MDQDLAQTIPREVCLNGGGDPIYLKDYAPPPFAVERLSLTFELDDTRTRIVGVLAIERRRAGRGNLRLDGRGLRLESVKIDGDLLEAGRYGVDESGLTVEDFPDRAVLEIEVCVDPCANKALEGLYKSGGIFCTQCEPEGFRRIMFYPDRPDVMALFETKIIADKGRYPVLLAGGNLVDSGDMDGGRHFAVWRDPFRKPCYLYALVAGDLALVEDRFKTASGRWIDLRIYVDRGNEGLCGHAMESLKRAMRWDEERFGLEYDLDIYMIVAVDSFNMGAMENKGLNIFNSSCVLADPEVATDEDFLRIESVVAHEYFHNWTGNRVTCRDWFQITLKEGLTVFRDQEFSADMHSRGVERIRNVEDLKRYQFPEDAGPTAHAIKPESYREINNFYTATVYEKGAEVVRMIHTFLGEEGFRRGMDEYFALYDGQAVTTEDFVGAMARAAGGFDFGRFGRWYSQIGTPRVDIESRYDGIEGTLTVDILQACQEGSPPLHFPLGFGMIGADGGDIPLKLREGRLVRPGLLDIREHRQRFVFEGLSSQPALSVNRGFSAPVAVRLPLDTERLCRLFRFDSDPLGRFEAARTLARSAVDRLLDKPLREPFLDESYGEAFGAVLADGNLDAALKALCLSLPAERQLYLDREIIDVEGIFQARKALKGALARRWRSLWERVYEENASSGAYRFDSGSVGRRALRATALSYLGAIGDESAGRLAYEHFCSASNTTDRVAALAVLVHMDCPYRQEALDEFYRLGRARMPVVEKWLALQAGGELPTTFGTVLELEKADVYDRSVPNLFRALIGRFAANSVHFHHPCGRGYRFVADKILEIDSENPQMAAGLSHAFRDYGRLVAEKRALMGAELGRIAGRAGLSKNTAEIVGKILKDAGELEKF